MATPTNRTWVAFTPTSLCWQFEGVYFEIDIQGAVHLNSYIVFNNRAYLSSLHSNKFLARFKSGIGAFFYCAEFVGLSPLAQCEAYILYLTKDKEWWSDVSPINFFTQEKINI